MSVFICKICGKEFIESNAYARHIKEYHKLQMQEYYDNYLKKPGEGLCAVCGNPTENLYQAGLLDVWRQTGACCDPFYQSSSGCGCGSFW